MVWVEKDLKYHLAPTLCHGQGYLSLLSLSSLAVVSVLGESMQDVLCCEQSQIQCLWCIFSLVCLPPAQPGWEKAVSGRIKPTAEHIHCRCFSLCVCCCLQHIHMSRLSGSFCKWFGVWEKEPGWQNSSSSGQRYLGACMAHRQVCGGARAPKEES